MKIKLLTLVMAFFSCTFATAQSTNVQRFSLTSAEGLELINVIATPVKYNGKKGLRISKTRKPENQENLETMIILPNTNFKNGTIEMELTGVPGPDANPTDRGFVGMAFRVARTEPLTYDCFYVRPTNARAEDQLQRNHTTQYIAHPDYTWNRLRQENPGQYESYTDFVPGEWTKIKIEVSGSKAKFYVRNMKQPCLIVNDLKNETSEGSVALWMYWSTIAHVRNLVITNKD